MHIFECQCGKLSGRIKPSGTSSRLVCYCADCQAFARFLGREEQVLDEQGGTEIVQLAQPRLEFIRGKELLAAVRLDEKGLIRWYSDCCKTPIGNTLANPQIAFIGMVHSVLDSAAIDRDFGRRVSIVNVDSAIGEPKPRVRGMTGMMLRFLSIAVPARLSGRYRDSPLFDAAGEPVVTPQVLSPDKRSGLYP